MNLLVNKHQVNWSVK